MKTIQAINPSVSHFHKFSSEGNEVLSKFSCMNLVLPDRNVALPTAHFSLSLRKYRELVK